MPHLIRSERRTLHGGAESDEWRAGVAKISERFERTNYGAILTERKSDAPQSRALGTIDLKLDLVVVGVVGRGGSVFCINDLDRDVWHRRGARISRRGRAGILLVCQPAGDGARLRH